MSQQFLTIQIEELQFAVNQLEEVAIPDRVGVPSFNLNPSTGKIQVLAVVHGDWVDKAALADIEKSLKFQAEDIVNELKFHIPELSNADIEVDFTKINSRTNGIINYFAIYKGGDLVIHPSTPKSRTSH